MITPDPFTSSAHDESKRTTGERLRRPEPSRTAPNRHSAGMFLPSGGETIDTGVDTAYRVLGDYLRRGQEAAQQQHARTQAGPATPWAAPGVSGFGSIAAIPLHMFRAWAQLAASWADMSMNPAAGDAMRQMLRFSEELWAMAGVGQPSAEPAGSAHTSATAAVAPSAIRFVVETNSQQPVELSVDFDPPADVQPVVQRLHPLRDNGPALAGLEFTYDASSRAAKLSLEVPLNQAPGRYVGTIFDDRTDQACGSVHVRVGD